MLEMLPRRSASRRAWATWRAYFLARVTGIQIPWPGLNARPASAKSTPRSEEIPNLPQRNGSGSGGAGAAVAVLSLSTWLFIVRNYTANVDDACGFMDVKVPKLGEGAESGTVVSILVKEGDTVAKGQTILELENEKAVAPIPSTASGRITSLQVKEGDKLSVGQLIMTVAEDAPPGAKAAPAQPAPPSAPKAPESATEVSGSDESRQPIEEREPAEGG